MNNMIMLMTLVVYLVVLMGIGLHFSKGSDTQEEYLMGKKIPGWALALSTCATSESAWMILAASGLVYGSGVSAVWVIGASIVGPALSWILLSKRVMEARKEDPRILTVPQLIASRFGSHYREDKTLRGIIWVGSILFGSMICFYMAGQFGGAGKTLSDMFGLTPTLWAILVAGIAIAYSIMGGFSAVVWTDVVQSVLMIILFIGVPIMAFGKIQSEGLDIVSAITAAGPEYSTITQGKKGFALAITVISFLSLLLSPLGKPEIISRYLAMSDEKERKIGLRLAIGWTFVAYLGVFALGIFGIVLYGPTGLVDRELLVPMMVKDLFPPWAAGIMLAGIIAAIMSTVDSLLLVTTSAVSDDIIGIGMRKDLTSKQLMKVSRIFVFVSGGLGLLIGLFSKKLVFYIINWYAAGVGANFAAVMVMVLFYKKMSPKAVAPMLISGFLITIIWQVTNLEQVFFSARFVVFIMNILIGFALSKIYAKSSVKTS